MKLKEKGNIYSINEANKHIWCDKRFVPFIDSRIKENYSTRWVGSLVADAHRTLIKGGFFAYPANEKNKDGKIRLLYEAYPFAHIFEVAGGFGSNAVSIGDSSDTVTIPGNLTVGGTTTTINTNNLTVKDVIISLNEGAEASADVAIIESIDGAAIGYDTSDNRWKFDFAGASASENTVSFDASVAAVVTSDDSNYRKAGNIRVESDEIYIYV